MTHFRVYSDPAALFKFAAAPINSSATERAIEGFKKLENGWHFGKGVAPTNDVVRLAIKLLHYGIQIGFTKSDAFPGISGEIQLSFYRDDATVELIVEPDQTISIFFEHAGHEEHPSRGQTYEQTIAWLGQISGRIWNTHVYLARCISTSPNEDTLAWHLGTHRMEAGRLSCSWAVQKMGDEPFVNTFGTITDQGLVAIPRSSGSFRRKTSRREVA